MKKKFTVILVAVVLSVSSCQNGNKETKTEKHATEGAVNNSDSHEIVTNSLTDDKGNTLDMKFDNAAGTATFVFNKDTIHLKQDTTASGVQCSNKNYKFTEHHGEVTLTKDGNIIFAKK
ncbi:MAG: MliC family protein [Sphingobacteriaceae bacterium]|nr:MliC family protein [Sphingobacteriaceae bacterium]